MNRGAGYNSRTVNGAPSEPDSRRRFGEVVAAPAIDLAEAAFLIACEEYPDLDLPAQHGRLEELGRQARAALDPHAPRRSQAIQLASFLGAELGFRGNAENYYDPRNSFFNDCCRAGWASPSRSRWSTSRWAGGPACRSAAWACLGHFIVRVTGPGRPCRSTLLRRARGLPLADCQRRLDRIFDRQVSLEPGMLMPCDERQILTRMLYNLKGIYVQAQDHWRALGAVELLLRLDPGSLDELRDRGLLYAALDCYSLAVRDLESYLARAGQAPDSPGLRETLENLRARQARVN